MRKVILILLSLLAANFVMYSQNEDIKPIVVKEKTTQGTKENHAPAKVQVECFYYSYTNSLELSFLSISEQWMLCLRIRLQENSRTMSGTVLQEGW